MGVVELALLDEGVGIRADILVSNFSEMMPC